MNIDLDLESFKNLIRHNSRNNNITINNINEYLDALIANIKFELPDNLDSFLININDHVFDKLKEMEDNKYRSFKVEKREKEGFIFTFDARYCFPGIDSFDIYKNKNQFELLISDYEEYAIKYPFTLEEFNRERLVFVCTYTIFSNLIRSNIIGPHYFTLILSDYFNLSTLKRGFDLNPYASFHLKTIKAKTWREL